MGQVPMGGDLPRAWRQRQLGCVEGPACRSRPDSPSAGREVSDGVRSGLLAEMVTETWWSRRDRGAQTSATSQGM